MYFWTNLIKASKKQTDAAIKSLQDNCTYVDNRFWIFEGEISALRRDGAKFKVVAGGAVPSLGGMSQAKLVELCKDVYGINVYEH